jgi:phage FluMu protein gp41
MEYQTETSKLPTIKVELKHGLLFSGKRVKTIRVRPMLAEDLIEAGNFPDATNNAVLMQLALMARLISFDGEGMVTVAMLYGLSGKDQGSITKAMDDADELDFDKGNQEPGFLGS